MILKKIVFFAAIGLFTVFMTVECSASNGKKAKVLKLGSIESSSGASASMGTEALRGFEYAAKKINASGGVVIGGQKYTVRIVQYDDQSRADVAVANAEKLIYSDGVSVIFGPPTSTAAMAVAKVTEREKVVNFLTVAAAPALTNGENKFVIRNTPTAIEFQAATVKFAAEKLKAKKFAILARNDDWGKSAAAETVKDVGKYHGTIVMEEYFTPGSSDFYSLLTKVKSLKPDALVVAAIPEDGVPLVKQARELKISAPIFGAVTWNSPSFIKALGPVSEGLYTYSSASTSKSEKIANFVKDFKKVMGTESQTYDKNACDAVMTVIEAMKNAGTVTDATKIRDALLKIDYNGVLGSYSFKPTGQGLVQLNINEIKNGTAVPLMEIQGKEL